MMRKLVNWGLAAWTLFWIGATLGQLSQPAHAQQTFAPANPFSAIVPNNTTGVLVVAGNHAVMGVSVASISATPAFIKFYDTNVAPTCGSGTPIKRLQIPGNSAATIGFAVHYDFVLGFKFLQGIGYCITTGITDADTTAPAANTFLFNMDWN